jgi:hypothetical protein
MGVTLQKAASSGSARASRAADDALGVGTGAGKIYSCALVSSNAPVGFDEGVEPDTRDACAPRK